MFEESSEGFEQVTDLDVGAWSGKVRDGVH